ncbi:putative tyrosine-protein kinase ephrin type A/B receptor [Plasmopara halstedii]
MDTDNRFFDRILAVVCTSCLLSVLLIAFEEKTSLHHESHLRVDGPSYEPVQLRLYLGVQPGNKNCPRGMYRPSGVGITIGECEFCPRGVYGDSPGLESKSCTAKCPKGTFNDKLGAKSILDCKLCPAGVFGSSTGLTSSQCSGPCPNGKYSMNEGVTSISACMDCPPLYRGPQGYRGNDITMKHGGGYPCNRYQYGNTIINNRDKNNDVWLAGYISNARKSANKPINDDTTPW